MPVVPRFKYITLLVVLASFACNFAYVRINSFHTWLEPRWEGRVGIHRRWWGRGEEVNEGRDVFEGVEVEEINGIVGSWCCSCCWCEVSVDRGFLLRESCSPSIVWLEDPIEEDTCLCVVFWIEVIVSKRFRSDLSLFISVTSSLNWEEVKFILKSRPFRRIATVSRVEESWKFEFSFSRRSEWIEEEWKGLRWFTSKVVRIDSKATL